MGWFPADQRGLALGVRQTAIPIGGAAAAAGLPMARRFGRHATRVHRARLLLHRRRGRRRVLHPRHACTRRRSRQPRRADARPAHVAPRSRRGLLPDGADRDHQLRRSVPCTSTAASRRSPRPRSSPPSTSSASLRASWRGAGRTECARASVPCADRRRPCDRNRRRGRLHRRAALAAHPVARRRRRLSLAVERPCDRGGPRRRRAPAGSAPRSASSRRSSA